ncbi:MAG: DUF6478 family protein [Pseudomonadota bacterium]
MKASVLSTLAGLGPKRRWARLTEKAKTLDLDDLRDLRTEAQVLRRRLSRFIDQADGRLALPLIDHDAIEKPLNADWAHRPGAWRRALASPGHAAIGPKTPLDGETTAFHDCGRSEVTIRQIRNTRAEDLAPFGLRLDVFRFTGGFLSLVIDLPHDAVETLKKSHVYTAVILIETEKPLEVFGRLNVKHGPNTEQIVREFDIENGSGHVAFDLAYTRINDRHAERIWLDLIFESPEMNQIILRDVTLVRHPRAEF